MKSRVLERWLLLLFVASGLAGLIYQSIWSQYLGLVLGHAAYAQTLVLAMFMGGMALGAWLVSRYSMRWRNLILVYAAAEAAIGLMALVFHVVFLAYRDYTYGIALPGLGTSIAADAYLWSTSALLIAPQTILLGATFPLMSAGYLRLSPGDDSRILGGLYFSNSIGAAIGALVSTFVLVPVVGLPGTLLTAGLLNLLVALGAWTVSKNVAFPNFLPAESRPSGATATSPQRHVGLSTLLVLAAAITGATSFVYEIGWVRLLNQAIGSSLHSFELMLSAFVLGLALGGRWVRNRSEAIQDVLRYAGMAQVLMGIAALLSLPIFAKSFEWVGWLSAAAQHSDGGYVLMSLGSSLIAMAVMVPAAFFAGMTLPLFTTALLRSGSGESGIGRVYAANTLGAIVGVFAVVHLLIPNFGVPGSVVLAGVGDIVLGFVLLGRAENRMRVPALVAWSVSSVLVAGVAMIHGKPDPRSQAAGTFRSGLVRYDDSVTVDFLRDGKTATVSVVTDTDGGRIIATNGKSDAGLMMSPGEPFADEVTMVMAGAMPLLLHPDARQVAVIGWGSGLSTHTMLGSSKVERVETIEIERAMFEGARHFEAHVERAYKDPRSKAIFDDARAHFARSGKRYDVIVSEPSNPWVAGVASLFTTEFYQSMLPHLEDDGILVQWLHTYEINDQLVATMMASLLDVFPQVDLYLATNGDMIFAASKQPSGAAPMQWSAVDSDVLKNEMARVGLRTANDWRLRYVGNTDVLRAFVRMMRVGQHSDFFPVVTHEAPRSMFKREHASVLRDLAECGLPVLDVVMGREPPGLFPELTAHQGSLLARKTLIAGEVIASMRARVATDALALEAPELAGDVSYLHAQDDATLSDAGSAAWMAAMSRVARASIGFLPASLHRDAWVVGSAVPERSVSTSAAYRSRLVELYGQLAARKFDAAAKAASDLLGIDQSKVPTIVREHSLVALMLDAAQRHDYEGVLQVEHTIGRMVPLSEDIASIRGFLVAWAELHVSQQRSKQQR